MFGRIKAIRGARYRRKVQALARQALALAAKSYESGEFSWTKFKEFTDGDKFSVANLDRIGRSTVSVERAGNYIDLEAHEVMRHATGGCALGGISKAAWQVTGEPSVDDDAWKLKIDVEIAAETMFINTIGREGADYGAIASFNDSAFKERVVEELTHASTTTA